MPVDYDVIANAIVEAELGAQGAPCGRKTN